MAAPKKRRLPAELMPTTQPQLSGDRRMLRAVSAVVILILGLIAITHTAAYQVRSQHSELAYSLAPYDGRIGALVAAYRSGPEASPADRRVGDTLARLALRNDPTAVVGASTMGLNAQVRGETPKARLTFAYSSFLSRREIQTQLWAIEDAVGRGSVVDALRHYDIVMRSTPSLSHMLFPTLTSASTDPEIRAPLIRTLAAKPAWGPWFIAHVAANTTDPRSTALLLKDLRGAGAVVPDSAQADMVRSLLMAGLVGEAWNYYATLHPTADRRASRDPRFMAVTDPPSQFDWIITSGEAVSAAIQRGNNYGVLTFSAPSMVGGSVIQQLQVLPAGKYRLQGHSVGLEHDAGKGPHWSLSCQGGQELGRVEVPRSDRADGKYFGDFNVPPGCPIQVLSLVARPSENIAGLSGQIDFLELKPEG